MCSICVAMACDMLDILNSFCALSIVINAIFKELLTVYYVSNFPLVCLAVPLKFYSPLLCFYVGRAFGAGQLLGERGSRALLVKSLEQTAILNGAQQKPTLEGAGPCIQCNGRGHAGE